MKNSISITVSLVCLFVLVNPCQSNQNVPKADIFYVGTPEYSDTVAKLSISPKKARNLLAEYIIIEKNLPPSSKEVFIPTHYILYDNQYLFSMLDKLRNIGLSGYYVDGFSGNISKKFSRETITSRPYWELHDKAPEIKVLMK